MPELEQLEAQQRELNRKVWDARDKQRQVEMAARIGKFYKYRNCYSCPEKPSDYWWLYGTYLRIGRKIYGVQFQTDKDGKFEIELREERYPSSGWVEISRSEYFKALAQAMKRIAFFKQLAAGSQSKGGL